MEMFTSISYPPRRYHVLIIAVIRGSPGEKTSNFTKINWNLFQMLRYQYRMMECAHEGLWKVSLVALEVERG